MTFDAAELAYLPDELLAWGDDHQELLALIVSAYHEQGQFPEIKPLTRQLARRGRPTELLEELLSMPGISATSTVSKIARCCSCLRCG